MVSPLSIVGFFWGGVAFSPNASVKFTIPNSSPPLVGLVTLGSSQHVNIINIMGGAGCRKDNE